MTLVSYHWYFRVTSTQACQTPERSREMRLPQVKYFHKIPDAEREMALGEAPILALKARQLLYRFREEPPQLGNTAPQSMYCYAHNPQLFSGSMGVQTAVTT